MARFCSTMSDVATRETVAIHCGTRRAATAARWYGLWWMPAATEQCRSAPVASKGVAVPHSPPTLIPRGAAYFPAHAKAAPGKYVFLLVPDFTLLAFSCALDPFRIANQLSQKPLYYWQVVSQDGAPVASSSGVIVQVEGTLATLDRDTTLFVCSGTMGPDQLARHTPGLLARHHRFGGKVGGICTGANALARAGLLKNRSFTLHWENQPAFIEHFPDLHPSTQKFEIDDRILTCGGGAAATDLALKLIEQDHGPQFAAVVGDMCLHRVALGADLPQRASLASRLRTRDPRLTRILKLMSSHLEDPLDLQDLAAQAGLSRRQVERLFTHNLGITPAKHYLHLRLDHARSLLSETDYPLIDIAIASGFRTKSHFSRAFRARFDCQPHAFHAKTGVPND
jgi:AraC family transcriptional regulator, carnitine catabolism transcriptional activator